MENGYGLPAEREAGLVQEPKEKGMLSRVPSRPMSSWEDRTIGNRYGDKECG